MLFLLVGLLHLLSSLMERLTGVLVVSAFVASSAVITNQIDISNLVRRHQDAMQIGAHGDTAVIDSPIQFSKMEGSTKNADLCNLHFLEGVEKTNGCADPTNEVVIEGQAMCKSAAELTSGIGCTDESCIGEPMEISSESFNTHPMRCYIDGGKWFYNPSGYEPANITAGTPICRVPELREGSQDSNDCHDTASYENILDETECRAADTCLGACLNENFRVSDNASPKGCHNATNGCVRFNTIETDPTQPKGKPICKHSSGSIATKLTSTGN